MPKTKNQSRNNMIQKVAAAVASSSNGSNRRARQRNKRNKNGGGKNNNRPGKGNVMQGGKLAKQGGVYSTDIPFGFDSTFKNSFFHVKGMPQRAALMGGSIMAGALRIEGRCSFSLATVAAAAVQTFNIGPNALDTNLSAITSVFEYYAFRRICVNFIPFYVGTASGTMGFALANNYGLDITNAFPNSLAQVLRYQPSGSNGITMPFCIDYTFTGESLYSCSLAPSGALPNLQVTQLTYKPVVNYNGTNVGAGAVLGYFVYDYVLDLYAPSQKSTFPNYFNIDFELLLERFAGQPGSIGSWLDGLSKKSYDVIGILAKLVSTRERMTYIDDENGIEVPADDEKTDLVTKLQGLLPAVYKKLENNNSFVQVEPSTPVSLGLGNSVSNFRLPPLVKRIS